METDMLSCNGMAKSYRLKRKRFIGLDMSSEKCKSYLNDAKNKFFLTDHQLDEEDNDDYEVNSDSEELTSERNDGPKKKILITEEKMSDALRQLQLEISEKNMSLLPQTKTQKHGCFYLSEELKNSIKSIEEEEDKFNRSLCSDLGSPLNAHKHMQIVPWIPNNLNEQIKAQCNDSNENNVQYSVEEHSEKKNLLKR